ncbi:hypothetical protein F4553_002466 [Allocatelliglobosispora scoriae]|uniref:Aminoglycoside phosphotransferase domain-containing protein n=1 Tax=Allocatelliglobosispora scoriae TaxID=643052 RepID=A0A841BIZ7_9ACTN|nr:phosphotransferase [Allocatelliglobosispora scoriae]MBB5869087.1 hypothetical protein [Allocatelliglobosispora scoriae]
MHEDLLPPVIAAVFGSDRRLESVTRLKGGSKKGAYRLTLDDGFTAVLYSWEASENFWPALPDEDPTDPFSHATGLDLFTAAHGMLTSLGVRTISAYLLDPSHDLYPADIALVEDVRGDSLEVLLARDPAAAASTMDALASALASMAGHLGDRIGKVALVERGAAPQDRSCEQVVADRALRDLADAAARVDRLGAVHDRLAAAVRSLRDAVEPRSSVGVIHGELGPDHVLVDAAGLPVLIDIEGLMHFDVEWEHVFLRIRFGDHYPRLHRPGLDASRLRLYRLAQHLSLVAGPLRLLDGDFPDRDFMLDIAHHHTGEALTFLAE